MFITGEYPTCDACGSLVLPDDVCVNCEKKREKKMSEGQNESAPITGEKQGVQGIGWAVKEMQNGGKVARAGWNGKNMWLALQTPGPQSKMTLPYVYMSTAQGDLVPWLCSQTDLLAIDWVAVT